jgi:hypothetical protein
VSLIRRNVQIDLGGEIVGRSTLLLKNAYLLTGLLSIYLAVCPHSARPHHYEICAHGNLESVPRQGGISSGTYADTGGVTPQRSLVAHLCF